MGSVRFVLVLMLFFIFPPVMPANTINDSLEPGKDTIGLVTLPFEMDGCISLFLTDSKIIINSQEILDSLVTKGYNNKNCLKMLDTINFDEITILGINLNTGWCRVPLGLQYQAFKIESERKYLLSISYTKPVGICRAMSSYDLWVTVPNLPRGYTVEFQITPE